MRDATRKKGEQNNGTRISTHAPHAGRDDGTDSGVYGVSKFLLTRPMRDATRALTVIVERICYFYSRAPCGTRRRCDCTWVFE